jgi:acetyl esterase/lipase
MEMRRIKWATAFLLIPVLSLLLLWFTPGEGGTTEAQVAIVAVHGGGWYGGTPAKMDRVCTDIAPVLGYDCFQPNYTLSGTAPHAQQYRDLKLFIEELRLEGYTHVIGIGASAGGNLVGTLASHGHLDVAVTLSAPTRLTTLADWYRDQCTCWVIDQFAPTYEKKEGASPALDVLTIPILIIHSQDEELIPYLQAYRLSVASTNDTMLTLPGDVHAMSYFEDVKDDIITYLQGVSP